MANLLYVTCNVRTQNSSRILSLGAEFLEEYLLRNPQDEVQMLDLYRDSIQRVDQDVLNARGRIERGEDYGLLSYEERRKMGRLWRLAEQFDRCDKYVFVTHSLNLWFPAEFKMYVDAICVPDRTYCLTSNGVEGTLSAAYRKSLHLHAGQPYEFGAERDQSVAYLESVLNFFGVTARETVLLQGDDPERGPQSEYEAVRRKLLEVARYF
ncbi:MAG: FMN-dependent NADH-azoreductase [Desulfobulbaceae bacterium]|nr:MAG: FMN-dependent NADH-azoreductase [Desulfobulbaceae bacterium]